MEKVKLKHDCTIFIKMCPNIFFIRNSHNDNNTIIPYKVVVLNLLPYNRLKCALKIHHFNPPDTCSCVRVSKAEQWYQQSDPEHKDDFTGGQSCIRLSITLFMFSWYNINQLMFPQGIFAKLNSLLVIVETKKDVYYVL